MNPAYLVGIGGGCSILFRGEPVLDNDHSYLGPDGSGCASEFNSLTTEILVGRELLKHQIVKLGVSE